MRGRQLTATEVGGLLTALLLVLFCCCGLTLVSAFSESGPDPVQSGRQVPHAPVSATSTG